MGVLKRFNKHFPSLLFSFLPLIFACLSFPSYAAADGSSLTSDERLKTKAVQLFVDRRYAEALIEFKILKGQYPNDFVLKRYAAACFYQLGQDTEALAAFQEILKLKPDDRLSLKYIQRIREREEAKKKIKLEEPKKEYLTPDERLKTKAVGLFIDKHYTEALPEFQSLSRKYPEDFVLKRYIAACLFYLKRYEEARARFQEILKLGPADRLSQQYMSEIELRTRKETAPAPPELVRRVEAVKFVQPKKWALYGSAGAEWVKNPTSASRERRFARERSESAVRFSNFIGGNYELLKKDVWSLRGIYGHSEAFYSDSLNHQNFGTDGLGATLTYIRPLNGRPFVVQFASTINNALRHGVAFSRGLVQSATLSYSPQDQQQLVFYDRWGPVWYEDDGPFPEHESRDGVTNLVGVANYFFFNKEKNFYTFLRFEYGHEETDGVNNDKNTLTYNGVLHFPFLWKTEGEVEFQFRDAQYPNWDFPFGNPRRRDAEYTFRCHLLKKLNDQWTLHGYYTYLNNDSRYDQYTFSNHTLGSSVSFSF